MRGPIGLVPRSMSQVHGRQESVFCQVYPVASRTLRSVGWHWSDHGYAANSPCSESDLVCAIRQSFSMPWREKDFRICQRRRCVFCVKGKRTYLDTSRMFFVHMLKLEWLRSVASLWMLVCLCSAKAHAEPIAAEAHLAESVSHYGITWTFSEPRVVGRFANGEWWVVGPVTIAKIDPPAAVLNGADVNGSMVNPSRNNRHGFDGRGRPGQRYDAELNIAKQLPLRLDGISSVVSVIHEPDTSRSKKLLKSAAVLTVLKETPTDGTLRPPYFGDLKPLYHVNQFRYDVLRNLEPTPSAPKLSELTGKGLQRVLIDMNGSGGAQANTELCYPAAPTYGRELAYVHNRAALALQLDVPREDKEPLLIEIVQRGIDVYGGIQAGYGWDADGGHRCGRKIAMYMAGKVLHDPDILKYVNVDAFADRAAEGSAVADYDRFQEGQQHFIVSELDVKAAERSGHKPAYTQDDIGLPEWRAQAKTSERRKGNPAAPWDNGYRRMNGSRNTAVVLIVTLMGDRELWNHEAMFRYITERYWPAESREKPGSKNGLSPFVHEMWKEYFVAAQTSP